MCLNGGTVAVGEAVIRCSFTSAPREPVCQTVLNDCGLRRFEMVTTMGDYENHYDIPVTQLRSGSRVTVTVSRKNVHLVTCSFAGDRDIWSN